MHVNAQTLDRRNVGRFTLLFLLAFMAFGAVSVSLLWGGKDISVLTWWHDADSYDALIMDMRIPRTAIGVMAGSALGIVGAIMQGLTRNPLADPSLLGVNAGASASIVTLGLFPFISLPFFWTALPGALLVSFLIFVISQRQGQESHGRLILSGAAISATLFAYVQGVLLLNPAMFDTFRFWAVGSLSGLLIEDVWQIVPYWLVVSTVLLLMSRSLNVLSMDRETAISLGARLFRVQCAAWFASAVLISAVTAIIGPIAFVGLASSHLVKPFTGPDFRRLLPCVAFVGATLLVLADSLARVIFSPAELPTGVVIALIGAPLLVVLAKRQVNA